jgi:hypothetical protein
VSFDPNGHCAPVTWWRATTTQRRTRAYAVGANLGHSGSVRAPAAASRPAGARKCIPSCAAVGVRQVASIDAAVRGQRYEPQVAL